MQPDEIVNQAVTWWTRNQALIINYGINIISALIIFAIGWFFAGLFSKSLNKILHIRKIDSTITIFIENLARYTILAFVIIAALSRIGVQTASFVAVIGAAGLAIGLALQGSLSNFASGILIIIFRPLKVGEFVDTSGTSGTVKEISIFSTILTSPDNKMIVVPNSSILNGNIINYSRMKTRRVDMVFNVAYGSDLKLAREVFSEIIRNDERVLEEPLPEVLVANLGPSSIDFKIRVWVKNADYWPLFFSFQEKVVEELAKAKIEIPFPQVSVHMEK